MHGEEGEVHTNQHQPEVQLAQTFVEELSCHLGEPVVHTPKDGKDSPTEQHIVNMRNHKVGICHLVVKGNNSQCCTVQTTNQEHGDKAERKQHGGFEVELPTKDRGDPVKDLHRRRNSNQRCAGRKEGL